jgi:hypothetical protein
LQRATSGTTNSGHGSTWLWSVVSFASAAVVAGSITPTTDQICESEMIAADGSAAINVSSVLGGSASGQ